jgi:hypothetical protein
MTSICSWRSRTFCGPGAARGKPEIEREPWDNDPEARHLVTAQARGDFLQR